MITSDINPKQKTADFVVVDAPEVSLAENEQAGELLLHFYRALGWNGEDILDPRKVRTTQEIHNRLNEQMRERCPDFLSIGLFLMNSGPGVDNFIPTGKVHLLEGWITPDPDPAKGDIAHAA